MIRLSPYPTYCLLAKHLTDGQSVYLTKLTIALTHIISISLDKPNPFQMRIKYLVHRLEVITVLNKMSLKLQASWLMLGCSRHDDFKCNGGRQNNCWQNACRWNAVGRNDTEPVFDALIIIVCWSFKEEKLFFFWQPVEAQAQVRARECWALSFRSAWLSSFKLIPIMGPSPKYKLRNYVQCETNTKSCSMTSRNDYCSFI